MVAFILSVALRMIPINAPVFQSIFEMYDFSGIIWDFEYPHHIWIILQQS